ncbi:MAG: DnaJ domain-containing protein [Halobacteriales archaeon]|nr:DnaJ domain-containing protein [Halobacteriales archaeon]
MDPYEVLGVPRDASEEEVKEAYREKVKEYHPDTSERDDSAEMFKRVRDAYEEVRAADRRGERDADSSHTGGSKSATDSTSSSDGFGTWRDETRRGGFGWEKTETEGRGYDGTRWGAKAGTASDAGGRGNFGDRGGNGEAKTDDPGGFETHQEYGMGWKLGSTETGDWFVYTEVETAPYVDGAKMLYLDADGRVSTEPVYFGTRETADEVYGEYYGADDGFGHEHEQEESHRGFSPKGESYRRRTEERRDGFGDADTDWGKRRKAADFDVLWKLYYQERRGNQDGERKRWSITTEVTDDDRFVNPAGESQRTEFWYDTRSEAVRAYKRYARRMRKARESFEDARENEPEDDWLGTSQPAEESFFFRAVEASVAFTEAVEDILKPVKERGRITAALLVLFVAVSVYVSESLREFLMLFVVPVYVGFVTVFETPYLIFFVFAYAAIVTVLIIARISTKY